MAAPQFKWPPFVRSLAGLFVFSAIVLLFSGCASQCTQTYPRKFSFDRDTFSYRNDLVWEYVFDDTAGTVSHRARYPKPDYTHHCFVVARSARQFFQHARFEPNAPLARDEQYRMLIKQVVGRDPARCTDDANRIVIPGFASLREFSVAKETLLQEASGGAWQSYFQRGHWRMMFPFTRGHQQREVDRLVSSIRANRPPVVHIVKFPQLTINHALLLYDCADSPDAVRFTVYDPFEPNVAATLTFDKATRIFSFPRNPYFIGGEVNIYEVYKRWNK